MMRVIRVERLILIDDMVHSESKFYGFENVCYVTGSLQIFA